MGTYYKRHIPSPDRLHDVGEATGPVRANLLSGVRGEVFEVGFGTGLNLEGVRSCFRGDTLMIVTMTFYELNRKCGSHTFNENYEVKTPNNAFVPQILKTDEDGEFAIVPVRAGWWALSAIVETDQKSPGPNGEEGETELGGVLWIQCVDIK